MKVQKEINLNAGISTDGDFGSSDKDKKIVQSNRELYERELKLVQRLWVNRLHKLFYLFLGLLAGMSLMHLMVVMAPMETTEKFMNLYSYVSQSINIIFMIFTSFALILGLAMTLIYKNKSDEKMRNMDPFRLEFRQHYVVSALITVLIAFCLGLLYILPHFTNKLYYLNVENVTTDDITKTKGLYGALNLIFLIAWLLSSAFNKASITDLDMDPEESADNGSSDNLETAEGSVYGE